MLEGALQRLAITPGDPARYELVVDEPGGEVQACASHRLSLNSLLNKGLRLEFKGRITCAACGAATRRSYADGHCYRCFRRLAACDLCVVNPVRCHYALGTCREPQWGEAFCMQPHVVYLANSSGAKVGITSQGGEVGRWLDQGATQGVVIARAPTRHLAGVLEDRLARRVSDRTDWRALLSGDAAPVDLQALRERLWLAPALLPEGVCWLDAEQVVGLRYPILAYPRRLARLRLEEAGTVSGRLVGIKGQYLLFDQGVLNVRRHRSYHVRITVEEADDTAADRAAADHAAADCAPGSGSGQMELFR